MSGTVHAVILAGGAGTRFWPASRRRFPKQLLPLGGEAPLLAQTIERIAPVCPKERVLVATGAHLVEATLAAVPAIAKGQLLVEPAPRNTAPCIGWAAHRVARTDPLAVVMALPSDHHIGDLPGYRAALRLAIESAKSGAITAIGVRPTHAETGYGYIEVEPGEGAVRRALCFVEKPDRARAEQFVASDRYLWNAGMFFFRARDMIEAIREHLPQLAAGLARIDSAAESGRQDEVVAEIFAQLAPVSIDVGVMEKVRDLRVVPGDFGWNDLGSWLTVAALAGRDARGNSAPASAVLVDADGCFVSDMRKLSRSKRAIALVGVRDLLVIDTDDGLLVVHRSAAQQVREVVERLIARGDEDLT